MLVCTLSYTRVHGTPGELYDFIDSESVIEPMRSTTYTVSVTGSDKVTPVSCQWTDPADNRGENVDANDVYADRELSDDQAPVLDDTTLIYTAYVTNPGVCRAQRACCLLSATPRSHLLFCVWRAAQHPPHPTHTRAQASSPSRRPAI